MPGPGRVDGAAAPPGTLPSFRPATIVGRPGAPNYKLRFVPAVADEVMICIFLNNVPYFRRWTYLRTPGG